MTLSSGSLRGYVRRSLAHATGTAAPDRAQLVSAFNTLSESLRQRLQTLFGTTAVSAMHARALQVATAEFPWLAGLVPDNGGPYTVDRTTSLERLDVEVVEEGLAVVLANNIGLLSTIVGEDLILPVVRQAWGLVSAVDAPSSESDQ